MSRYETLCAALRDLREKYNNNRTDIYSLVGRLLDSQREFLGVDEEQVSLFATLGSWAGKKVDGPAAAINLGEDTFWHFGIAIDVVEEDGQMPVHTVGFEFQVKKLTDHYLLVLKPEGTQFQISAAVPARDLETISEHLYQFTLRRYGEAYQGYFVEGQPNKRFGF